MKENEHQRQLRFSYLKAMGTLFGKDFLSFMKKEADLSKLKDCPDFRTYLERNGEIRMALRVLDHIQTMTGGGSYVSHDDSLNYDDYVNLMKGR